MSRRPRPLRLLHTIGAAVALAALTSLPASAECSDHGVGPCLLPLISIPPSIGARVQGGTTAFTAGLSLGLAAGPRGLARRPALLTLVELGVAVAPPSGLELWVRASTTWLFDLGESVRLGPTASVYFPEFNVQRLAAGLGGTLMVRLGGLALRLVAQVEQPFVPPRVYTLVVDGETTRLSGPWPSPVFSVAVAMSPW